MPVECHHGRNLTGLYLGVDGCTDPPQSRKTVPCLTRARYIPSKRVKTPTEKRRHMVEQLRVREEKKGFIGQPLKQPRGTSASEVSHEPDFYQQFTTNFWDITRQTSRHFTAATNSGVTHFERLHAKSASSYEPTLGKPQTQNDAVLDHMGSEVNRQRYLAGLQECYRRVCKGNIETLYSLLPNKRSKALDIESSKTTTTPLKYTGFAVKSYRNPKSACIMANFCDTDTRSRTAAGSHTSGSLVSGLTASCAWKNVQSERVVASAGPIKAAAEQTFRSAGVTLLPPPPSRAVPSYQSRLLNTPCEPPQLPAAPQPRCHQESASRPGHSAVQHTTGLLRDTKGTDSSGVNNVSSKAADDTWTNLLESKAKPLTLKSGKREDSVAETPQSKPSVEPAVTQAEVATQEVEIAGQPAAKTEEVDQPAASEHIDSSADGDLQTEAIVKVDPQANTDPQAPEVESTLAAESSAKAADDETSGSVTDPAAASAQSGEEMAETLMRTDMTGDKMAQLCGQSRLLKTPSGADITIGLEDESGKQKPIEIDVVDPNADCEDELPDVPQIVGVRRRVSITERILNMKNSEEQMLCLTETAETRKQELADLLDEHAHIVAQVSTMEVCRDVKTPPGANKENSAYPMPPSVGVIHDI